VGTAYACSFAMGYAFLSAEVANLNPLSVEAWMDLCAEQGLAGVELPISEAQCAEPGLTRLVDSARSRNLTVILDGMVVDEAELTRLIGVARRVSGLQQPVVRAILSRLLCGDRRPMEGGWEAHLQRLTGILRRVAPIARDAGVHIALENHQDAGSDELIQLCEESDPEVIGVCLDTANPLAVGEDCVEFARKTAPYLRHVHLKDYTMHAAPLGFRLVRCACGDGVVDFPAVLSAVAEGAGYPLLPGIEVGAHTARHVQILDDGWWSTYPNRRAVDALPALRVLWQKGLSAEAEWRTPAERGEGAAAIIAGEMQAFERSCSYFRWLWGGGGITTFAIEAL
jgi:sugar phosphate isomerase/epimerase